ncbi:hypothetical protein OIU78_015286, partial [Salix suchowensis]
MTNVTTSPQQSYCLHSKRRSILAINDGYLCRLRHQFSEKLLLVCAVPPCKFDFFVET